ncbi:MAG TPA: pyridoxamine 5'-phosphate oxidase family protein [Mycobacterium sp.]|nr:pyridoxamine 5'-phosphate oxidase family protein [Mycobacterium sp.]
MSTGAEPIVVIPEDESWQLLASRTLGRLATSVGGQPEIFPVNFVVQRRTVLFRTAEGTKLASAVANNRVAFEVDEHNVEGGWSVIVKGQAQMLRTQEEIAEAERAQLLPWIATRKRHFVRIVPTEISGRRFQFGTEPDEDFSYAT